MSNIQTGAERMPHDLSHLGFLAGQIGRLITISTTPVIAGDSFEMDAVGALRLSPLRFGLALDSTVDIFTFYVPYRHVYCFFFNDTATTEIYTLSLHDALPIWQRARLTDDDRRDELRRLRISVRSEEHTSELQSLRHLVCRLLLEKKKHQRQLARALKKQKQVKARTQVTHTN